MNNNQSQYADAHALKILKERLWHFTSVGMGNCRAAQRVRREIERRFGVPALAGAGDPSRNGRDGTPSATRPPNPLANQTLEQLTAGLLHLESVGLANSRAAQITRHELSRRLLIQGTLLLANAGFNPKEARDWHGQWTNNATGSATNRPSQTKPAISGHHSTRHPAATTKPKTSGPAAGTKPPPAAAHHAGKTAASTNAPGTHVNNPKPPTRTAGIVYNETSGIYPALKPGAQVGGSENWSPESRKALNEAREQIAEIANAREKKVAASAPPGPKYQTPVGKAQWQDCLDAATRAEGKKSSNHFVIWPSDDGKTPTEKPRMQKEDWPYDYKKNITAVYGPFRVPLKVGDVPAGSNIYIFFYKDVP